MSDYFEHDVQKVATPPLVFDTTHPDETDDTSPGGAAGALVALDGPPVDGGVPTYDSGTGKHTSQVPGGGGTLNGLTDVDTTGVADGDVLTYDSGSSEWIAAAPTGGAGSALTLLEQHTASSSATLDFTTAISATYDEYQIELLNLIPATDLVNLYLRMSTNGGSSYDAGANYSWTNWAWRSAASGAFGASGTTQIILDPTSSVGVKNTATNGLCGTLRLFSPASTSVYKQVVGQVSSLDSVSFLGGTAAGIYLSTTAVNAFRFLFSSGNIASGIVRVYGIAK